MRETDEIYTGILKYACTLGKITSSPTLDTFEISRAVFAWFEATL